MSSMIDCLYFLFFPNQNLLFLFEVMQLKNELISRGFLRESEVGKYHKIGYVPDDEIRRKASVIHDVDDYQQNIVYIVDQYIENSGIFAINISYKHRQRICEQIQSKKHSHTNVSGGKFLFGRKAEIGLAAVLAASASDSSVVNDDQNKGGMLGKNIFISTVCSTPNSVSSESEMKEKLSHTEKDVVIKHLLVLDVAVHEILILLSSDSFSRFVLTSQYRKLIKM